MDEKDDDQGDDNDNGNDGGNDVDNDGGNDGGGDGGNDGGNDVDNDGDNDGGGDCGNDGGNDVNYDCGNDGGSGFVISYGFVSFALSNVGVPCFEHSRTLIIYILSVSPEQDSNTLAFLSGIILLRVIVIMYFTGFD